MIFPEFVDNRRSMVVRFSALRTIHLSPKKISVVDCGWNVMAHAQKANFIFRRNGRVHLNLAGGLQFSRLLAAEVCASAVVMLDTPCSEVVWRVLATHSIRQFPFTSPPVRHRVPSHFNWALLVSVRDLVGPRAIVRPDGLSVKNSFESATFRLVGQCVNQLNHRLPPSDLICVVITMQSVSRQVLSRFQSEFFTERDRVLPLQVPVQSVFLQGHPVTAYAFILFSSYILFFL